MNSKSFIHMMLRTGSYVKNNFMARQISCKPADLPGSLYVIQYNCDDIGMWDSALPKIAK